jgi:hypothetical protein
VLIAAELMTLWAPAHAAAQSACPTGYLTSIADAQSALNVMPPDTAGAVAALQRTITAYPTSQFALEPVLQRLTATPPQDDQAKAMLDSIASTLALPPGTTCNADQRPAISTLHGVYASPVFANLDRKPAGPNPITQFLSWLASLLHRITGALGPAGSIAVGAVLLAAALAFAAWRLRGVLGSRAAQVTAGPEPDTTDPSREWTLAAAAAGRSDFREAIRRAFRSALLMVALQGRLAVDPSWTTHELLAATVGDARLLAALAPAADLFDRAWYSGEVVTGADWEQARVRCQAVRELARSRAPVETV